MKILITGNMGYIGPAVVQRLRSSYPDALLAGLDMGYFANCLTNAAVLPECRVDTQYFMDVRNLSTDVLEGVDSIVHLAAISNDPMGNTFEKVTYDINHVASIALAKKAKEAGVKNFVYASSCSMYGAADDGPRTEDSALNPLTAYAKSKVATERDLKLLADGRFRVTSLRFSTACGMSERLRLDLVLNDFVAGAVSTGKITILSDGTPWRPLIDIKDMAKAVDWAVAGEAQNGGDFLAVNVGSDEWNYQVGELAGAVASLIPGVEVSINGNAQPDKRSYRVGFGLFRSLAPQYQPSVGLAQAIKELKEGLEAMNFRDGNFRSSGFMRLKALTSLREQGLLTEDLEWAGRMSGVESTVRRQK
ncbi:MAG: SDR family oxidoreductase [Nitrospirae bacterium]|nr:SDR family oxidoreductase [Nitrospirota bacterium]